ncbi:MAG TPA: hypothetical protein PLJ21_13445, partial [Pseudobdellovibrionaceae bacterium]|nr:hypothetical protein [Pseudobdellovibrionaceae bacterium]
MLPSIIDSMTIDNLTVISTSSGSLCVGFELNILDAESNKVQFIEEEITNYLGQISNNIRVRFILDSFASYKSGTHSRENAIHQIGFVENRLYVFFEKDVLLNFMPNFRQIKNIFSPQKFFESDVKQFLSEFSIEGLMNIGAGPKPLTREEYDRFMTNLDQQISTNSGCISSGDKFLGLVKLVKQATHKISVLTLSQNKDVLSLPYRYVVTLMKESHLKTERELRQNSNQAASGNDVIAANSYIKTQNDMKKVVSDGNAFFHTEAQFILSRSTISEVKEAAMDLINSMRALGKFYLESVGVESAWRSSILGEM